MPTSAAQFEANRANAQKSTGPATPEGKAAASRNAISHGLNSKEIFVRPGDEAIYLEFEENLISEYQPGNEAESIFFKILVHSAWNLRRCRQLETELQIEANSQRGVDPLLDESLAPKAQRVLRYSRAAERSHLTALRELRKLQTERSYRSEANPDAIETGESIATDTKAVQQDVAIADKSRASTSSILLRNRFGPNMPALFDNEDGTMTAYGEKGKAHIRVGHFGLMDIKDEDATGVKDMAAAA